MNIAQMLSGAKHVILRNSPTILTVVATAGVITTATLAVKATPRALEILQEAEEQGAELTTVEKVRHTWKCYIPALAVGAVTVACVISANTVNLRRYSALSAAYAVTEKAMEEYQRKAIEVVGEKKDEVIRGKIAQDRVDASPVQESQVILTGKGETLCMDTFSGRYFKSDVEKLRRAENTLNQRLINGTWLSLNELYSEIGLDPIKLGDNLGWVPDNLLQLQFSAVLADEETPCLVMDYLVDPKLDYYSSY